MKVTVEVDCTPEEARRFLGLPDVVPMQQAAIEKLQQRMESVVGGNHAGGAIEGVDADGTRSDAAGVRQAARCFQGIKASDRG